MSVIVNSPRVQVQILKIYGVTSHADYIDIACKAEEVDAVAQRIAKAVEDVNKEYR